MTPNYRPEPLPNYPDPSMAYSYAIDTTGGLGYSGGYSWGGGSLGAWGLGSGLAAGYPKGSPSRRTPALMGWGGLQFIPDGGVILSQAIDDVMTRLGPVIYDMMENDDCVNACLSLLVHSIVSEVHVEPAVIAEPGERLDETTDPQRRQDIEDAKKYADEVKRSIARCPEFYDEVKAMVRLGIKRGSALCDPSWEVVQGPGDDKPITLLKSVQCKAPYVWGMVVNKYGQFDGVVGYSWEGPKRYDRDRFLVYVNRTANGDPRGTSGLRPAYDPWNFKQQARPEEGKWLGTFSNPTVVITYDGNVPPAYPQNPDGTEDTTQPMLTPQSQAERVAANVHGASWMAIPEGWKAELVSSPNDGGAFNDHEERRNKAISMAILLNSRTNMEAGHGSKADSDSSVSTTMLLINSDQVSLSRTIERGFVRPQILMNHGDDAASRLLPRIKFPEPDKQEFAAKLTACVSAGYKFVPRQFAKLDSEFDVPVRTADEIDELQAQEKATQEATVEAMKAKAQGPVGGKPGEPPVAQGGKAGKAAPAKGESPGPAKATPAKPAKPPAKAAQEKAGKAAKTPKASADEA